MNWDAMNWWLSIEIGVGILLGTILTRILDWALAVLGGGGKPKS